MFDNAFADRKPESRALFEGVEFDEPVENPPLPFGRNAAARVGDVETEPAALRPVAEADRPFGGEFRGVGQQVDQQLRKPVAVGVEQTCVKPRFEDQFDAFGRFHADDVLLFVHQFVQLEVREVELQSSGLDLREVEDVADQLQEQGVVVLDDRNVFPFFLLLVGLGKDAREPYDGVERRADFVAHVGQEGRFEAVRLLGAVACRTEVLLQPLARRDDERRSDEVQRAPVVVALVHGGLCLHPVQMPASSGVGGYAVLLAHLVLPSGDQVVVGAAHPLAVFLVDLGEIAFRGDFQLLVGVRPGEHLAVHRFVHVAQDRPFAQVPFPGHDVRHVERHRQLVVNRIEFLLRFVERRAVEAEDVDVFFEVRAADHHFVEDVARFVIIGVGDGPVLGLCDFYQPHEFGHREGEQFADPSSDRLLAGDEYAFVTGVHVAVEGVCGVAVFVVNHLHLDVDDRHGVEQVRIFRQTFRFPLPGRFHAVHHANAPLLDADEGQQQ